MGGKVQRLPNILKSGVLRKLMSGLLHPGLWSEIANKSANQPALSLLSAISLAWLGWEHRHRHLEHTTYGGANGEPDPLRNVAHAAREMLTGDPDKGGARAGIWQGAPRIRPMSTANERFLARVLEAHVLRTLLLASSGATIDDARWRELHIPKGFVEEHLAALGEKPEAEEARAAALRSIALPDKARMTVGELQEAKIHKWSVTREQAALFLRTFLAVEHAAVRSQQAQGKRRRSKQKDHAGDLTEKKMMKILRLTTGRLNDTQCVQAHLKYDLGSPEHTHESTAVNVAAGAGVPMPAAPVHVPGTVGIGVTKTSGVTRTRHRLLPAGIDVEWFDPSCLQKLTVQKDKELLARLKEQPDVLKQILRQVAAYPLTYGIEAGLLGVGALGVGAAAHGLDTVKKRLNRD